jgi:hypothetical protein
VSAAAARAGLSKRYDGQRVRNRGVVQEGQGTVRVNQCHAKAHVQTYHEEEACMHAAGDTTRAAPTRSCIHTDADVGAVAVAGVHG